MNSKSEFSTSIINGVGSYVPSNVVDNFELSKKVDTSDEWITSRTGIKSRRIARVNESTSDLALEAAKAALEDSKCRPEDIDLVIFWIWEYDERGLFGTDIKAIWSNYYIECNKNRFRINDMHGFSDTKAKNKIYRDTAKSYDEEWLPITFEESAGREMNPFVLSACNLI